MTGKTTDNFEALKALKEKQAEINGMVESIQPMYLGRDTNSAYGYNAMRIIFAKNLGFEKLTEKLGSKNVDESVNVFKHHLLQQVLQIQQKLQVEIDKYVIVKTHAKPTMIKKNKNWKKAK